LGVTRSLLCRRGLQSRLHQRQERGHAGRGHADPARHGFGQLRIARHGRQLILPQIEKSAGEALWIGRFGHGASIWAASPETNGTRKKLRRRDGIAAISWKL
jgi:hypothetical protein